MRYGTDFESSVIAAVNHDGDSDTVASICGNLQGAMLGMEGLPEYDLDPLELRASLTRSLGTSGVTAGCRRIPIFTMKTGPENIWKAAGQNNGPLQIQRGLR